MIIIILTTMITTSYGAELVFCTPTPTGRKETADKIAAETGGVIVHPYDNEDVIAGQVGGCHLWALLPLSTFSHLAVSLFNVHPDDNEDVIAGLVVVISCELNLPGHDRI